MQVRMFIHQQVFLEIYNKKKKGFSTISTVCGQINIHRLNKLSTSYAQSVDNQYMLIKLFRVKTQI